MRKIRLFLLLFISVSSLSGLLSQNDQNRSFILHARTDSTLNTLLMDVHAEIHKYIYETYSYDPYMEVRDELGNVTEIVPKDTTLPVVPLYDDEIRTVLEIEDMDNVRFYTREEILEPSDDNIYGNKIASENVDYLVQKSGEDWFVQPVTVYEESRLWIKLEDLKNLLPENMYKNFKKLVTEHKGKIIYKKWIETWQNGNFENSFRDLGRYIDRLCYREGVFAYRDELLKEYAMADEIQNVFFYKYHIIDADFSVFTEEEIQVEREHHHYCLLFNAVMDHEKITMTEDMPYALSPCIRDNPDNYDLPEHETIWFPYEDVKRSFAHVQSLAYAEILPNYMKKDYKSSIVYNQTVQYYKIDDLPNADTVRAVFSKLYSLMRDGELMVYNDSKFSERMPVDQALSFFNTYTDGFGNEGMVENVANQPEDLQYIAVIKNWFRKRQDSFVFGNIIAGFGPLAYEEMMMSRPEKMFFFYIEEVKNKLDSAEFSTISECFSLLSVCDTAMLELSDNDLTILKDVKNNIGFRAVNQPDFLLPGSEYEIVFERIYQNEIYIREIIDNEAQVLSLQPWLIPVVIDFSLAEFLISKTGYADPEGNIRIDPEFDGAALFSHGCGLVWKYNREMHSKYGFIDDKGNMKIPCIYEQACPFTDGLAAAKLNGKWGFIDILGQVVVPFEYDSVRPFVNNIAAVMKNPNWGYIGPAGNKITECIFFEADDFNYNITLVYHEESGYQMINKKGKYLLKEALEGIYGYDNNFFIAATNDGMAIFNNKGKQLYLINEDYKVGGYSEGMISVSDGELWGFLTSGNELAIDFKFNDVKLFSEGLAAAKEGYLWGYIGPDGEFVIDPVREAALSFKNGYAGMLDYKWDEGNDKYDLIFINKQGQQLIPFRYFYKPDDFFEQGVIRTYLDPYNNKYMYMNDQGKFYYQLYKIF
ncbi:MAG: WG repeat-containing protein [Bacteroidota bacterium]